MDAAHNEHQLIGNIYDAALNTSLWPSILEHIARLADAASAIITAFDSLNADYTLAFTYNIPEEALHAYREHGLDALDMEVHGSQLIKGGLGSFIYSSHMYGSQEEYLLRCGDLYHKCFAPSNIHYVCGTLLDYGDYRWAGLGLHRPEHQSAFTPEQTIPVARMAPHVRRALHIHRQLASVEHRHTNLYRMLDGLTTGVILLNGHGLIRYANAQAEQLLRRHGSLRVTVREGLQAAQPGQDDELRQLIQGAVAAARREASTTAAGGVMGLQESPGTNTLMVTVTPLSELAGYAELAGDGIAAAIFLSNPHAQHRLPRSLLRNTYKLTERECDLCEAFVNHISMEHMASACALSISSLRSYMKTIYEKTHQHSQAELMRLLMGLTLDFEHIR